MIVVRDMWLPPYPLTSPDFFLIGAQIKLYVLAALSDPHKRHSNLTTVIKTLKGKKGLEVVISSFITKASLLWKVSHPHVHSLEKVHFKSKLQSVITELLSDRLYM